jgi:methanethiol S-methyltransferase
MEYITLTFLWLLFFVPHSVLAANGAKRRLLVAFPILNKAYRLLYNIQSLFFFGFAFWYQKSIIPIFLFEPNTWMQGTALLFMLSGLLLMLLSFRNYSASEFLGLQQWRQKSFNAAIAETLSISGLNQYVRHPLYSASFLFLAAYFVFKPSYANLVFVALSSLYLVVGTYLEEQKLIAQFGDAYLQYQKRVGRFWPRGR